jgi:ribosomal protein S17
MMGGRWLKKDRIFSIFTDIGAVVGLFSVVIAVLDFFPVSETLVGYIKTPTFLILLTSSAISYGVYKNRPRNRFIFKICNRDVTVELLIGSIFDTNAAYIVPVNSSFDMDLNGSVLTSKSVKAEVIKRFYGGNVKILQKNISRELTRKYKGKKENNRYKLGTVVRVETENNNQGFYFVANSHKINESRVECKREDLYETLYGLWAYISANGSKERLAIPLLGTGHGRLTLTREEVYQEIIRSFITSCASKSYCEKLTIVIQEHDVTHCKIDIEKLVDFTRLNTEYAGFSNDYGLINGSASN